MGRVTNYLVTAIDVVDSEGCTRRLSIVPSESLPPVNNHRIDQKGRLTRMIDSIDRLNRLMGGTEDGRD